MAIGYRAIFDRKTNQNLVSKQKNEVETRASEESLLGDRIPLVLKNPMFVLNLLKKGESRGQDIVKKLWGTEIVK